MAGLSTAAFPWECRDKEDQAQASFHHPMRRANRILVEENMRLKRILRENGISWSPLAQAHLIKQNPAPRRRTRASMSAYELGRPTLPTEVILRILKFALKSPYPVIDPLSRLCHEHLSEKEKTRGNQVAIHFLATCRVLHTEGTRYFWESNRFTFTTPEALRNFSELSPQYRNQITHLNLRIIARYYDDQRRKHRLDRSYHADLKKDQLLKVRLRPKEPPLIRGGFRCYTWSQITDFLMALRAPYDPNYKDKNNNPRPRLLPGLLSLRLDLVNFSETLLPFSGSELHEIASHELGCTLNELQVTGMPFDDAGMKASAELSGMLKDEGLFLDGSPSFIAHAKHLQPLSGKRWCARVVRAFRGKDDESDSDEHDEDDETDGSGIHGHAHARIGTMPPAPAEEGHPTSSRDPEKIIWKRVPLNRDDDARYWVQFSRRGGYEIIDPGWETDEERICPCCGEGHPSASSFLSLMMEHDDDDDDDDDDDLMDLE
ncbi:uncharacterized protein MAM_06324 [Metarhizium album ARSEF 1941]|uniref:Uncharacterized protein n=1 Tax=Metarhizium album (strain ARSEF 1941) TaxID=1081103 RepID=A0A0B2WQD8_METAS|nr:uncharacterized protein MAM_06324 [Metarhizium album ARSEF 1941]KHN95712.1 hypothetical protein MAM_06324 [Metarhizium album ARSEF 1941]